MLIGVIFIGIAFIFITYHNGQFFLKSQVEQRAYFKKKFVRFVPGNNFDDKFRKFVKFQKFSFFMDLFMFLIILISLYIRFG